MAETVVRGNPFDVLSDAWHDGLVDNHDAVVVAGIQLTTITAYPWLVVPVFNAVWDAVWAYRSAAVGGAVPWNDPPPPSSGPADR
jgi:hypothetical protein